MIEQIILSGGVVFGIRYSNDFFCAKYVKIDNLENLSLLNGSKYITTEKVIDGVGVFKSVYNVLLNQRKVLFIGTPCDIGNLISFLKKNKCQDFDKLVTLDFICQGPIKAKVQKEYIRTMISIFIFTFITSFSSIYSKGSSKICTIQRFNMFFTIRKNCS